MATCNTCKANKVCDHNKFGFENCGNYISVDAVKVKHGKWINKYGNLYANYLYICSVCGEKALYEYYRDVLDHIRTRQVLTGICPHCGATMNAELKTT